MFKLCRFILVQTFYFYFCLPTRPDTLCSIVCLAKLSTVLFVRWFVPFLRAIFIFLIYYFVLPYFFLCFIHSFNYFFVCLSYLAKMLTLRWCVGRVCSPLVVDDLLAHFFQFIHQINTTNRTVNTPPCKANDDLWARAAQFKSERAHTALTKPDPEVIEGSNTLLHDDCKVAWVPLLTYTTTPLPHSLFLSTKIHPFPALKLHLAPYATLPTHIHPPSHPSPL